MRSGNVCLWLKDILNGIMKPLLHVNAIKRRDRSETHAGTPPTSWLPDFLLPSSTSLGPGDMSATLSKGNRRTSTPTVYRERIKHSS